MTPEFWHERWKKKQTGFHQKSFNADLQKFWPLLNRKKNPGRVLVPLCGKSLDVDYLLQQGETVTGIELNLLAIKSYFIEHRISPNLVCKKGVTTFRHRPLEIIHGNFFDVKRPETGLATAFYDRAALIALPAHLRRLYVRHLCNLLDPAAIGLLITVEYPENLRRGPPFSVREEEVLALYGPHFNLSLLKSAHTLAAPHLRQAGLASLTEKVWILRPI